VIPAADLLDWTRGLVSLAFVLCVPLLLISSTLRWMVTDRDFLLQGFRDNRVGQTTRLDDRQLERIADAFVAYFQAPPSDLQMNVQVGGQTRPLFNAREVEHMRDVQALVQLFLKLQVVAAAVVLARALLAVGVDRSSIPIGREMLWSVGVVLVLVALVGVLSLANFAELWTRFHEVAFRNDLWQLDPARDYLIMLFPEPFWFAATLRMAIGVAVLTVVVALGGLALTFGPRMVTRPMP
jgi:integral membrane protein (TIGR01906 family)